MAGDRKVGGTFASCAEQGGGMGDEVCQSGQIIAWLKVPDLDTWRNEYQKMGQLFSPKVSM